MHKIKSLVCAVLSYSFDRMVSTTTKNNVQVFSGFRSYATLHIFCKPFEDDDAVSYSVLEQVTKIQYSKIS